MRQTVLTVAIMATLAAGVATIGWGATIPEVRPFVGAFIPTGAQRDVLDDALFVGAQGGIEMARTVHLVGTLAWAPHDNKAQEACVYNYDVGVETFRPYRMSERWEMRPFIGGGLGGRTYVDHANDDHRETNFLGYGALGTEFQLDRLAIRVEARDYITRFKGLRGDARAEARNDVAVVSALVIHW